MSNKFNTRRWYQSQVQLQANKNGRPSTIFHGGQTYHAFPPEYRKPKARSLSAPHAFAAAYGQGPKFSERDLKSKNVTELRILAHEHEVTPALGTGAGGRVLKDDYIRALLRVTK